MSSTNSITIYSYSFSGNSVFGADIALQFTLSTGTILPAGFGDTSAISFGTNLQTVLVNAGFTDAVVSVSKTSQTDIMYTESGGSFV